jgi:tetratricopeptide (TPR) repeat protein
VLILAALIFLFFFTQNSGTDSANNSITGKEMPEDEIHKGLKNPGTGSPGKDNVSGSVMHQLEALKKEVEENPGDTVKLKQYADLLAQAHNPKEAIVYYYTILNVNPGRTDVLFALAYIYYNLKDYDNTEKMTNRILLYDENNLQAKFNLGVIAAARGEKEKARSIWKKLIQGNPGTDIARKSEESLKKI